MQDTVDNLYSVFDLGRLEDDFMGCDCCVAPEHSARLAALPVRELTYEDLERYSRKAISTWGRAEHFKYFLPRLLELSIDHRDDFLDLAVVFGKLKYAEFDCWPSAERDAVIRFFDSYWNHQLNEPIASALEDSVDTVLCAISNALSSVQRFLDAWVATRSNNAKRHLAAFILRNAQSISTNGILGNAFWETSRRPHTEVLGWLQSNAVSRVFNAADDAVLEGDFAHARPQLMAIRSALGTAES